MTFSLWVNEKIKQLWFADVLARQSWINAFKWKNFMALFPPRTDRLVVWFSPEMGSKNNCDTSRVENLAVQLWFVFSVVLQLCFFGLVQQGRVVGNAATRNVRDVLIRFLCSTLGRCECWIAVFWSTYKICVKQKTHQGLSHVWKQLRDLCATLAKMFV